MNTVRRLTPLECERLQGFPDGWTDIGEWVDSKGKTRKDADSPRYKALGNSIALPFWDWLAGRICEQYDGPVTMGSLFDGIGGFPTVFRRHGATPVWASEIEEFPIAVTKRRFPDTGVENMRENSSAETTMAGYVYKTTTAHEDYVQDCQFCRHYPYNHDFNAMPCKYCRDGYSAYTEAIN